MWQAVFICICFLSASLSIYISMHPVIHKSISIYLSCFFSVLHNTVSVHSAHYHTTTLPQHHTNTPPHYPTIIRPHYQTIVLSHYHTTPLSHHRTTTLPPSHVFPAAAIPIEHWIALQPMDTTYIHSAAVSSIKTSQEDEQQREACTQRQGARTIMYFT
jgi:hypothetical protein